MAFGRSSDAIRRYLMNLRRHAVPSTARAFRVAYRKPYTPKERYTERRRELPSTDTTTSLLALQFDSAAHREATEPIQSAREDRLLEEQFLGREITWTFSKMQFHRTESGNRIPDQQKFKINLEIARMADLLKRLDDRDASAELTPNRILDALRHLTEYCLRHRMVLWFNFRHLSFIHRISSHMSALNCSPREAAVFIWMISKLGRTAFKGSRDANPTRALLTQLVQKMMRDNDCQELPLHDTMLLINGLANLDCAQLPHILDACLPALMAEVENMSPALFALFVWSYGKLGYLPVHSEFYEGLKKASEERFEVLTVQQRSSVAWGLARMGAPDAVGYLRACLSRVQRSLSDYVPLGIARLMDTCYLLNHHPGEAVVRALSNRFAHFRGYATPALSFQALPAFAYFGQFPQILFQYSHQFLSEHYSQLMDVEERIRVLSAYSVADTLSQRFFEATLGAVLTQGSYEDLPEVLLRELWISLISHKAHYGPSVENAVPKKLLTMMQNAWRAPVHSQHTHSLSHEIQTQLQELDVTSSVSYLEPGVELMADLVCLWDRKRVVLLVVDTDHVFSNLPRQLNGQFLWKERIFLKLGYGVGRVIASQWQLLSSSTSRQYYLRQILKTYRSLPTPSTTRPQLLALQDRHIPAH